VIAKRLSKGMAATVISRTPSHLNQVKLSVFSHQLKESIHQVMHEKKAASVQLAAVSFQQKKKT
jgi:hypothetical protein